MQSLDELKQYYRNLLIIQYHNQPKAQANIEAFVQLLFADGMILDVINGYDVNTAVGIQLTVLGKYVGIDRVQYGVVPERSYFCLVDDSIAPEDNVLGFTDGENFIFGYFYDTQATRLSPYTLTDSEMRTLIRLKIITNNTTAGFKDIKDAVFSSLLGIDVYDTKNMSLTYVAGLNMSNVLKVAIYEDLLPCPSCCGRDVYIIKNPKNIFGFRDYNRPTTKIGFSTYAESKLASVLSYQDLFAV